MGLNAFADRCKAIDLPWQSLDQALSEDQGKPIMCFMGQSLDAWSWRMADALAADNDVCDLIHTAFIPVYVNPREHSGAAALCQQVLGLSAGASGWPACMFLLPDGRPFGAIPYSPMRDADRRSGLATVLVQIAETWIDSSTSLVMGADALEEQLTVLDVLPDRPQRAADLILQSAESACIEAADTLEGGFGEAPRHIPHALLRFMLNRIGSGKASQSTTEHCAKTYNALIAGGIHDHLGGGFHRAVQDNAWNLPFFEKRCGDSAQLIPLLLDASDALGLPLYAEIAQRTGDWLIECLQGEDGFFRHGLHALCDDPNGTVSEGGTYAWSEAGTAAIVGETNAHIFAQRFLTGPNIADGFSVPNAKGALAQGAAEQLPTICARLAAARLERPQPWPNDEVLLEEQGMMLCGLHRLIQWSQDQGIDAARWQQSVERLEVACVALSGEGLQVPQIIHSGNGLSADNRSLAWLGLGLARSSNQRANESAVQLAAALWALRRKDGTLAIRSDSGESSLGDQLPAVLDNDESPSAAAVAAELFHEIGHESELWNERFETFMAAHKPLLAISQLPSAGLAAVVTA